MDIKLRNVVPRSIVMAVDNSFQQVDFISQSTELEYNELREPSSGALRRFRELVIKPKLIRRPLTIALASQGTAHRLSEEGANGLNDAQFKDYCNLIRELVSCAVPRFHGYGEPPEREAFIEDIEGGPEELNGVHARIIWTQECQVAVAYVAGFGATLHPWASKYHENTNFPAACKALWTDIVVVVPKFWIMTPSLREALISARGKRYKF